MAIKAPDRQPIFFNLMTKLTRKSNATVSALQKKIQSILSILYRKKKIPIQLGLWPPGPLKAKPNKKSPEGFNSLLSIPSGHKLLKERATYII